MDKTNLIQRMAQDIGATYERTYKDRDLCRTVAKQAGDEAAKWHRTGWTSQNYQDLRSAVENLVYEKVCA